MLLTISLKTEHWERDRASSVMPVWREKPGVMVLDRLLQLKHPCERDPIRLCASVVLLIQQFLAQQLWAILREIGLLLILPLHLVRANQFLILRQPKIKCGREGGRAAPGH